MCSSFTLLIWHSVCFEGHQFFSLDHLSVSVCTHKAVINSNGRKGDNLAFVRQKVSKMVGILSVEPGAPHLVLVADQGNQVTN